MVGEALIDQLKNEAERRSMNVLSPSMTADLLRQISKTFGIDETRTWWWDGLPDARFIDYTEATFRMDLDNCLRAMNTVEIKLIATDDEAPPWVALEGAWSRIREVIEALPFFEFFVVDKDLTSIVFDTHLNRLVIGGLLARKLDATDGWAESGGEGGEGK